MSNINFGKRLLPLLIVFLFTSQVFATNGYFRHGYGIKYSALAGAGVALSMSSLGAATNPAGLAFLGNRYDFNVALFSPAREYTVTGNPSMMPGTLGLTPGTVESESNYFPMPTLGANFMLNETMALGVMFFGNGGMNSDYPTATFYDPQSTDTGVNLEQMFLGVTYSVEFTENHALGITALLGYQRFAAKGLLAFGGFSSNPAAISGNQVSTSTGFGARIGYMGKILPQLSIGASYQTKMAMGEFEEYAGLFAEAGDFDIPANWTVGVAGQVTDQLTLAFDVQQILYSGIKSIANPMDLMTNAPADQMGNPNPNFQPLGTDEGWGFGWEDVMVYKFGVMYQPLTDWTFMAGYSYGEQPFGESEVMFNILAPAVVQHHITFGVSKLINDSNELTVAFMYAPEGNVVGPNPLDIPNQQTIDLKMSQWQLEIGYAFN